MTTTTTTTTSKTKTWQPKWWNEVNASAWDRAKEALRRDWEQTKHDFGLKGGHELNQSAIDTIKQVARAEPIPPADQPNPPKVIGHWDDVEFPIGYGYTARQTYNTDYPVWNDRLEAVLRSEWEAPKHKNSQSWDEVKSFIQYGYDYRPKS